MVSLRQRNGGESPRLVTSVDAGIYLQLPQYANVQLEKRKYSLAMDPDGLTCVVRWRSAVFVLQEYESGLYFRSEPPARWTAGEGPYGVVE
jgi:hypothetical protein